MYNLNDIDKVCILRVLDSISKIKEYFFEINSFDDLEHDRKAYDAVLMNFIIIGEMISKLSSELKRQYKEIPWPKIKNLRNIIAHNYFGIDPEEVWQIATLEIPLLETRLYQILDNISK